MLLFFSYRTMKENIGELLHELDQTRSGDKTWDHNQSFGLHKLLKIVDGESRLVSCTALTLCPLGNFLCFFTVCCFFFKIQFFEKLFLKYNQECQTNWIQIRHDILSALIWVQTVCQGYQQMTLVGKDLRSQVI